MRHLSVIAVYTLLLQQKLRQADWLRANATYTTKEEAIIVQSTTKSTLFAVM